MIIGVDKSRRNKGHRTKVDIFAGIMYILKNVNECIYINQIY